MLTRPRPLLPTLLLCMAGCSDAHAIPTPVDPATRCTITRTNHATYETRCGPLTWVISGDYNPKLGSWKYRGAGSLHVRELRWKDTTGVEWKIGECANCDVLTSLQAADGSTNWTAGGYGFEGDRYEERLSVDGVDTDLAIGAAITGQAVTWSFAVSHYAGNEQLLVRDVKLTIDAGGLVWRGGDLVRGDGGALRLVYAPRWEAPSICSGGLWSGWEASTGDAWEITECQPAARNEYHAVAAATWAEMTSTVAPIRLRIEPSPPTPTPVLMILNRADGMKHKIYFRPVHAFESPIPMLRGEYFPWDHRVVVEFH